MKKNILITFIIFISFSSYSQNKEYDESILSDYKKSFNEITALYSNFCGYSRVEINTKLTEELKKINQKDFVKEISSFPIIDNISCFMANAIIGFDGTSYLDKANELLEKIPQTATGRTTIYTYNLYFWNIKNNKRETIVNFIKKIKKIYKTQYNENNNNDNGKTLQKLEEITNEWNKKNYTDDLSEIQELSRLVKLNLPAICNGEMGGNEPSRLSKKVVEKLKLFDNNNNLKNDYLLIQQLFVFYKELFALENNVENQTKILLTSVLNEYEKIICLPNSQKMPLLKDYEIFFKTPIHKELNYIVQNYKNFNLEIDWESDTTYKIDSSYINNSPCKINKKRTGFNVPDTTKQNKNGDFTKRDEAGEQDQTNPTDSANFKKNNLVEKEEITLKKDTNIIISFNKLYSVLDSNFINNMVSMSILLTNIAPKTTYKEILDLYEKHSYWALNNKAKYCKNERKLIFNALLSKNRTQIYKEDIKNYNDMKEWRKFIAAKKETDFIGTDKLFLYNKKALLLCNDINPDEVKYVHFGDFLKTVKVKNIKIATK